jgi:hypothetical protein
MVRRIMVLLSLVVFIFASTGHAGGKIEIEIPDPPPIPDWLKSPPKVELPPPPNIKLNFDKPEHFFYSEKKGNWFYYDEDGDAEFVKGHVYVDDGKHFYQDGKKWNKANSRYAKKKGWKIKESKKKWWRFWD